MKDEEFTALRDALVLPAELEPIRIQYVVQVRTHRRKEAGWRPLVAESDRATALRWARRMAEGRRTIADYRVVKERIVTEEVEWV